MKCFIISGQTVHVRQMLTKEDIKGMIVLKIRSLIEYTKVLSLVSIYLFILIKNIDFCALVYIDQLTSFQTKFTIV